MSRCLILSLSLSLALPTSSVLAAAPAKDDAEAHYEIAAEHYAKEEYEEAAREFAIAYALEPNMDILFAWAQAERLAGDLEEAANLYRRLLDEELEDEQREAIEQLLAEIEPEIYPDEPEEPLEKEVEEPEPEGPDGLGIGLAAAGGGLALVGAGLLVGGRVVDSPVLSPANYEDFASNYDRNTGRAQGAVPLYAAGGVSLGIGIGVLVAGVVRLAKGRPAAKSAATPAVRPWFGPARAGLGLHWKL